MSHQDSTHSREGKKGAGSRVNTWFRSFDDFGRPVQMTYQGGSSYKTAVGAVFTILAKGIMIMFVVLLAVVVVGASDQSSYEQFTATFDLSKSIGSIKPFAATQPGGVKRQFRIAMSMYNLASQASVALDARYGRFIAFDVNNEESNILPSTGYDLKTCTMEHFTDINFPKLKTEFSKLHCLSKSGNDNFKFIGIKGQEKHNHLSIKFLTCKHLKRCATDFNADACIPLHKAKDLISDYESIDCMDDSALGKYLSSHLPTLKVTAQYFDGGYKKQADDAGRALAFKG